MRKLRRTRNFDVTLELKSDQFIRPPTDSQRNWLLNRVVREAAEDLAALDEVAANFVPGADPHLPQDMADAELADQEIMEDWQIPLMEAMARVAAGPDRDVLEVGFGRGISAESVQRQGAKSHTIIECNRHIARRYETWRKSHAGCDIRLVLGLWQETIIDLGQFDSILFHTYALDEDESTELLAQSVTFAQHFFATAADHLVEGGTFTYLSNEIDSLSRTHQRALLQHFRAFRVSIIDLDMPRDVRDAWWAPTMALVEVTK